MKLTWISVNDRLPPDGADVFMRVVSGRKVRIASGCWHTPRPGEPQGRGVIDRGTDRVVTSGIVALTERVTHWAERPPKIS